MLLVLPSSALAVHIETQSNSSRGVLTIDVHQLHPGQLRWNQLHYRLNACGHSATCHWELYGRITRHSSCYEHDKFHSEHGSLTFFNRLGRYGDPVLSLGVGHAILPPEGWGQHLCWYIALEGSENLTLTAVTTVRQ